MPIRSRHRSPAPPHCAQALPHGANAETNHHRPRHPGPFGKPWSSQVRTSLVRSTRSSWWCRLTASIPTSCLLISSPDTIIPRYKGPSAFDARAMDAGLCVMEKTESRVAAALIGADCSAKYAIIADDPRSQFLFSSLLRRLQIHLACSCSILRKQPAAGCASSASVLEYNTLRYSPHPP